MKLRLEQSRLRESVIRLNKLDELTDEQRTELNTATDRLEAIEPEIRSAMTAEAAEQATEMRGDGEEQDAEIRERNNLARRAKVGVFLRAAVRGQRIADGIEAELCAAYDDLPDGDIPMAIFDIPARDRARAESRAITPAPATGLGVNLQTVQPYVFASSIASALGIDMPDVPSGSYAVPRITTPPSTAAPVAKGGTANSTAAALTVETSTPKRVPARLSLALEDIAAFGHDSFEPALRMALQSQLSHSLDNQIINGNGTAPNLNGLLNQLTNPTAPAAKVEDFERWAAIAAGVIDGLWARSMRDVSMIWNVDAYRQSASVFQGMDGETSAASYLMRETAGFRANSRMPATATHIATGIAARLGQPGLMRAAVPSWGRITVDDIYTNSAEGQRHITISAIVGDLLIVQPDAYAQLAARVSTT